MSEYEKQVIEFESARNEAIDKFYAARPQLERAPQWDFLFESGFRMAWELLKREAEQKNAELHKQILVAFESGYFDGAGDDAWEAQHDSDGSLLSDSLCLFLMDHHLEEVGLSEIITKAESPVR